MSLFDIFGSVQFIIAGAVALVAAFFGVRWKSKRDGKKEAYDEMADQDRAEADGIRKRKRDRDARGVQPGDIRYRDKE